MANFEEIVILAGIENLELQENFVHLRRRFHQAVVPMQMNDRLFIKTFRLNKILVNRLINLVLPFLPERNRISDLSVKTKVLVALNFYATGSYQLSVGSNMYLAVSQSSVSRCVTQITDILNRNEIFNEWVRFPRNLNELNVLRQKFFNTFGIPGVVGCIDCTHVAIVPPKSNDPLQPEFIFVNRKNYHSLNVQLICEPNLKILNINSRFPGSTHDAHIWNNSNIQPLLRNIFDNGHPEYFLLGDSGYPLRPWLLTPLHNPLPNGPEENYNLLHKRTRATIERCNGLLKARFRCLLKHRVLHYDPEKTGKIINACSVLHNMCVENRVELINDEEIIEFDDFDVFEEEFIIQEPINGRINPLLVEGRRMQRRLITQLVQ